MNERKGIMSVRGHSFYAGFLNEKSVVVDIGAHLGEFSSEMAGCFGCRCYSIEASPSIFSKIIENRLIKKFNYAITDQNGPISLFLSNNQEGNSINRKLAGDLPAVVVEGINLKTFLESNNIASVDLLKVDIEGAEINLFESMSDETLKLSKQITIEFHDFIKELDCVEEVINIKKRLIALDFYCIEFSRLDNTDVLFINKKKCDISDVEYLYLKYIVKYIKGFSRMVSRMKKDPVRAEG